MSLPVSDAVIKWWEFGLWGVCGGAAVLAIEFWGLMREKEGKLPARFKRFPYWIGEFCRILVGGVLAIALGQASQVTVPIGALTVGVAAPLILSRLGEYVPRMPNGSAANEENK